MSIRECRQFSKKKKNPLFLYSSFLFLQTLDCSRSVSSIESLCFCVQGCSRDRTKKTSLFMLDEGEKKKRRDKLPTCYCFSFLVKQVFIVSNPFETREKQTLFQDSSIVHGAKYTFFLLPNAFQDSKRSS